MAVSNAPWDGSPSKWPDGASYCKACLIDQSPPGQEPTKDDGKLPIYEPNGDINRNAVHSAASVLAGGMGGLKGVSAQDKRTAAKKLLSIYQNDLQEDAPPSLKKIAGA